MISHKGERSFVVSTPHVRGRRYSAEVPDTFDLADRARLAINVLTRALVPQRSHAAWHEMNIDRNPPCFKWANWLTYKWIEALARMRTMSGHEQNLDVEQAMMQAFVDRIGPHGLLYYPSLSPDQPPNTAYAVGCGRMMLAMAAWHDRDGDPRWLDLMKNMARGLDRMAIRRFHYAYFPLESGYAADGSWAFTRRGGGRAEYFPYTPPDEPAREQQGHEGTVKFEAGTVIRGLVRTYEMTGDESCLDLARRLAGLSDRAVLVMMREVTPEALLDQGCDAYVNTACPRLAYDDQARFPVPVLTPAEFEILLGIRSWEDYVADEWGEG